MGTHTSRVQMIKNPTMFSSIALTAQERKGWDTGIDPYNKLTDSIFIEIMEENKQHP